ncbi:hypothetical protein ACIBIZ_51665 [Nonomuraea spiralis]|uniref:hypothetical protein n=1 Tax=Nonomuraea TaxID=83681 RepID=UPI000F791EAB|nr:hypothetical protein [Nonomuraea sp. WAC 01424]
MSDPYRIDTYDQPARTPRPRPRRSGLRALLWVLTVAGASVNLVANFAARGELTLPGLAGGVVGAAGIAGLIVLYVAGRRS